MEKKVKKKLKLKGLIIILLTLYLIIMGFYYVFTLPIKTIVITGNTLTTDNEIIAAAGIENYPIIFKTSTKKMKRNIVALDFISSVKIRKNIFGKITIEVIEEKIMFYNSANKTYVLSNAEEVAGNYSIGGIPILINYTPDEIYLRFINGLSRIDASVLNLISEIEYDPSTSYDSKTDSYITTDAERFLLRMNDGHFAYINIPNIEKLNKYISYIASLGDVEKGILLLDSDSENIVHKTFSSIKEELMGEDKDELSEEVDGDNR